MNIYQPMFLAVLLAILKIPGRSLELSLLFPSKQQHSLAPKMHILTDIPQSSLQNYVTAQQNLKTCNLGHIKEINIHF